MLAFVTSVTSYVGTTWTRPIPMGLTCQKPKLPTDCKVQATAVALKKLTRSASNFGKASPQTALKELTQQKAWAATLVT